MTSAYDVLVQYLLAAPRADCAERSLHPLERCDALLRRIFLILGDPPLNSFDGQSKLLCDSMVWMTCAVLVQDHVLVYVVPHAIRPGRPFDPIESLRRRVHLVIELGIRKGGEFVEVIREPRRLSRQINKAILHGRGLSIQTHLLVPLWHITFNSIYALSDPFLDERSARGSVLDQAAPLARAPHA